MSAIMVPVCCARVIVFAVSLGLVSTTSTDQCNDEVGLLQTNLGETRSVQTPAFDSTMAAENPDGTKAAIQGKLDDLDQDVSNAIRKQFCKSRRFASFARFGELTLDDLKELAAGVYDTLKNMDKDELHQKLEDLTLEDLKSLCSSDSLLQTNLGVDEVKETAKSAAEDPDATKAAIQGNPGDLDEDETNAVKEMIKETIKETIQEMMEDPDFQGIGDLDQDAHASNAIRKAFCGSGRLGDIAKAGELTLKDLKELAAGVYGALGNVDDLDLTAKLDNLDLEDFQALCDSDSLLQTNLGEDEKSAVKDTAVEDPDATKAAEDDVTAIIEPEALSGPKWYEVLDKVCGLFVELGDLDADEVMEKVKSAAKDPDAIKAAIQGALGNLDEDAIKEAVQGKLGDVDVDEVKEKVKSAAENPDAVVQGIKAVVQAAQSKRNQNAIKEAVGGLGDEVTAILGDLSLDDLKDLCNSVR